MNAKDRVVKHLEMIQGVINRLGYNSFLIKGWSMAILVAGAIFVARIGAPSEWIILTFLIPVAGFWILDGYFLWQERLFRAVYDDVRKEESTDFSMDAMEHAGKPKCTWREAVWPKEAKTLSCFILPGFYIVEILFIIALFLIFSISGGS